MPSSAPLERPHPCALFSVSFLGWPASRGVEGPSSGAACQSPAWLAAPPAAADAVPFAGCAPQFVPERYGPARLGDLQQRNLRRGRRALAGVLKAPAECDAFRLHPLFGSGMVLQHSQEVCLRGWGQGADVVVRLDNGTGREEAVQGTAGPGACEWRACLPPRPPGPRAHRVRALYRNRSVAVLADVVFGEVFLCAGQSNMVVHLQREGAGHTDRAPRAELLQVRDAGAAGGLYAAPGGADPYLQRTVDTAQSHLRVLRPGGWTRPTVHGLRKFSAACYHFGSRLYALLQRLRARPAQSPPYP